MTSRVAGSSRNWPAYALTFVSGALLAKLMPFAGVGSIYGTSGALTRALAPGHAGQLFGLSGAAIAAIAVLIVIAISAMNETIRKACAARVGAILSLGAETDSSGAAASQKNAKRQEMVQEGLEKQLNQLLKAMSAYLDANDTQSEKLAEIDGKLASADSVEKIQVIVELLAKNSADSRRDAATLRASLHEAQQQTIALRQKLVKAERLAALDPLTSLPNRRTFEDYLETAVVESHSDYTPLTVVMVDIDHFKKVNDKFGHATGDAVLRQFGKLLAGSVRASDMVARYGGEEFVVVLKKTPVGNAVSVVERIQSNIRESAWLAPGSGPDIGGLSASFGIAEIVDNETAAKLIERADQRLYAAKRGGRNRAVWTSGGKP